MAGEVDSYESKYMDGAASIARSRMRMPWWFFALLALPFFTIIGTSVARQDWPPLLALPVIALIALLFSHLRVNVTARQVIVQMGPFGPRIPVEAIEACEVIEYKSLEYGGYGIKVGNDGAVAYSVPGGDGRAVRVRYRAGDKLKTAVITANDTPSLAAAIEQARAAARGGVRVAGAVADPVAEAEAMARSLSAEGEVRRTGERS